MFYEELIKFFEKADKVLGGIINATKRRIKAAPEGTLYTGSTDGRPSFHVGYRGGKQKYIPKDQKVLLRRLSQKVYDTKLLRKAQVVKTILQNTLSELKKSNMDEVFENLPVALKPLVQQYELTDDEYAAQWLASKKAAMKEFEEKDARRGIQRSPGTESTMLGEMVRSKSEQLIANLLHALGISYIYEYPYVLKKPDGTGNTVVRPDFTVLNKRARKEFVIEHLGMLDDPVYVERLSVKLMTYFANGWYTGNPLLFTSETLDCPLDTQRIRKMLDAVFLV